MRTLLEPGYTAPPTLRSLDRNAFLPDDLSYQDMWQKPALLMMAYVRSLQYWAEKQSLPRSQNLCPLAESVIELLGGRERICHPQLPRHHTGSWDD